MRTALAIALLLGAVLRVIPLPLPGTGDVGSWKTWSFAGSTDATGFYGVGGQPPERRLLRWRHIAGTTEYPPLALYELAAVGRIYRHIDPSYSDGPTLTALIKAPGLLAEGLLVFLLLTWGKRVMGPQPAIWAAVAFWLNPVVILNGSVLGYLDAQMAVPAVLAFMAAGAGQLVLAGALAAAAILTKAQALFIVPVLASAILFRSREHRTRAILLAACGGAVGAALLLLPIVIRGAWANMVQAIGRLAAHDMLSGNAANLWWILTWIVRAIYAVGEMGWWRAFTMPVRILGISRWMELGFPNPRLIGTVLVVTACAWAAWRIRKAPTLAGSTFAAAWCVCAYVMFGAQVHENHWYLAVPLAAIAAALDRRHRSLFWTLSVTSALNLYLFYGLGDGWPPIISRSWTFVDATVWLSVANVGMFLWFTSALIRLTRQRQAGTTP